MRSSRENEQSYGKRELSIFVDANAIVSGLVFELAPAGWLPLATS
jgi:hypothetical protein